MVGAAALALAAAAALLHVAWPVPQQRAWALLTIAGTILFLALREVAHLIPLHGLTRPAWNWSGHLLAFAGMLVLAGQLSRRAALTPRDFGFVPPASLGPAVAVGAAALLLSYGVHTMIGGTPERISASTWLFLAIVPGPVEEVAFRGVLLAAAERAAPASRRVAGVPVSIGATLLTAAFIGLHGLGLGQLLSVLPAALLYLWLRLKTGSVLVPIVAHNLWNLTVLVAHADGQN